MMLDWRPGQPISQTRLSVPIETVSMASLSSTYLDWIRNHTNSDDTLRLLVNNGVPLRTSMAIDISVINTLKQAKTKPDVPANFHPDLTTHQKAQLHYADAIDPTRPFYCGCRSQCGHYHGPLDRDPTLKAYSTALRLASHTAVTVGGGLAATNKTATENNTECRCGYANYTAYKESSTPDIRSMLVDTGASGSLNFIDIEHRLPQSTPSQYSIAVAKGGATTKGSKDGYLPIYVLNTAQQPGSKQQTAITFNTTTVGDLRTELFSLDRPYRQGKFNVLLRQPDFESEVNELYRPATQHTPEIGIPLRYDYTGTGGWWIDYILHSQSTEAHHTLLQRQHEDMLQSNTEANAIRLHQHTYSTDAARELYEHLRCHSAVRAVMVATGTDVTHVIAQVYAHTASITARHRDERQIKGIKAGLKHGREKLPIKIFHKRYGHIGNCDDTCDICRMVKGNMRHTYKTVDPYRETRPAHTWSMDTVVFSHRALSGNKYATVLRCKATGVIKILYLYLKNDIVTQFEQWVKEMRAGPAYADLSYPAVSTVVTDNAGEWDLNSANWNAMLLRLKHVEMIYTTPETSKEGGHAEKSNSMVEAVTKAILMEQNLPEDHWEVAARAAEWLLNRFPNLATDATAPINGDQALPLELITRGRYSRRQIYRELSYFVMRDGIHKEDETQYQRQEEKAGCSWEHRQVPRERDGVAGIRSYG